MSPSPDPTGRFRLDGRAALVTGASSGLGARFAAVLAAAGAVVHAVARRADRLEELARAHERVVPVVCDVADPVALQDVVDRIGPVDVLVNNAGVPGLAQVEQETPEVLARVLQVNVAAPFELCRLVAAGAPPQGASIVNIASIQGLVAGHPVGGAAYAASKGALIAATRELAAQWGPRGIRVNALAPGWFDTEMTAELFGDERATRWVHRNTLLSRAGRADELDGALLFLASDAGSYVTGQVLAVDGGWTAR